MTTRLVLTASVALATATSLAGHARADELLAPITLSSSGLVANPAQASGSCTALGPEGPLDEAHLYVREAARPDVGPYTVTLPGFSTDGVADSYRPFLLKANPGDTLRFDLTNQLASNDVYDQVINLHTHGLVVSPRSAAPCGPPGDNVYTEVDPGVTTSYRIDIPATLPGRLFGATNANVPYPSGLYWFHAHWHGSTVNALQGGQAGILALGDTVTSLEAVPGAAAADIAELQATDTVYMGLRDIQLAIPKGTRPDNVSQGTNAIWLDSGEYDFQGCRAAAHPDVVFGAGFCSHGNVNDQNGNPVTLNGNYLSNSYDTAWLFTVNGQRFPNITLQPGRNNLWRIANLSDSASYVVQLQDSTGTAVPIQVVNVDGLAAGTSGDPTSSNKQLGVNLTTVLMMPATRAEIFIPNTATTTDKTFTLISRGADTGVNADPNVARGSYQGFNLPVMPLASVLMKGGQATAQAPLGITLAGAAATTAKNTRASVVSSLATYPSPPANCIVLPQGGTSYGYRRRITFGEGAGFLLGSEVINAATGASINSNATPTTIAPQVFPMAAMTNPNADRHVCPRLGDQEVWELINTTNETHNFHIHQTKFRLSIPGDRGVPRGYTAAQAIQDPSGVLGNQEPEIVGQSPVANVDMWHDVIPVPPSYNGTPGRVFVTIPFKASQQLGYFVYHCHILYHEDQGMMAVVQVIDPLAPQTTVDHSDDLSAIIRASVCGARPPPTLPAAAGGLLDELKALVTRRT